MYDATVMQEDCGWNAYRMDSCSSKQARIRVAAIVETLLRSLYSLDPEPLLEHCRSMRISRCLFGRTDLALIYEFSDGETPSGVISRPDFLVIAIRAQGTV